MKPIQKPTTLLIYLTMIDTTQNLTDMVRKVLANPIIRVILTSAGLYEYSEKYAVEIIEIILANERGREILSEIENASKKH